MKCTSGRLILKLAMVSFFVSISALSLPALSIEKQFRAQHSNLCLSTNTDSALRGAPIIQEACDTNRSTWDVIPIKGDLYRVVSKSTGLCLAVTNDSTSNAYLIQETCNNAINARLWRFNLVSLYSDAFYELKNGTSFRCIDVAGASSNSGAQTLQWDCLRGDNQHWKIAGGVPDTLEQIEFKLLVVNKPVSLVPGLEHTMPDIIKQKMKTMAQVSLPKYVHDYTNGRVKLSTFYYESPHPLTTMKLNSNGEYEFIDLEIIPEDLNDIANPGWYDGVLVYHDTPINSFGHVAFSSNNADLILPMSNVKVDDFNPEILEDRVEAIAGSVHEWIHQLEGYYFEQKPERRLPCVTPNAMLDCAGDFGYTPTTDNLNGWLAFLRDFLNGNVSYGVGGLGQEVYSLGTTPKDRYAGTFVPGGPLSSFLNKTTCLNLTTPSGAIAKDISNNNNFGWVRNPNGSNNWTGTGFLFDGADDYLRISNLVGDNFTISAWIKSSQIFAPANSGGTGIVYSAAGDSGFELRGIRNANGADVMQFTAGNFSAVISNTDITTNNWVHIAVVRNQSTGIVSLFVNGNLQATGSAGTQRLNKNPVINIGKSNLISSRFNGEMADFCVYSSALDNAAITSLASARANFDVPASQGVESFLSDKAYTSASVGWGALGIDKNVSGNALTIGSKSYTKGIGTHAYSKIVYQLDGKASLFRSDIGIDFNNGSSFSSADFWVYGNGNLLYRSRDKHQSDQAESISVDIRGITELVLITGQGESQWVHSDSTNWGNARIFTPFSSSSSSTSSSVTTTSSSSSSSSSSLSISSSSSSSSSQAPSLLSNGRPVAANSTLQAAANAVDGNASTRWESAHGVTPSWLSVDLGSSKNLTQVIIDWEAANAANYAIEGSNDNASWTTLKTVTGGAFGNRTDAHNVSGTFRYVRINCTARSAGNNWGYSIFELKVYGTTPVTFGSLTPIGVMASTALQPAASAIDGNGATRWESSFNTDPSWLTLDLGSVKNLASIAIDWEAANAANYLVQGSNDNSNWATLSTKTGGAFGNRTDSMAISGNYRYVRIYGTARSVGNQWGYSIWEVRLTGN